MNHDTYYPFGTHMVAHPQSNEFRTVVAQREERHMSAIVERVDCGKLSWFVLTTKGKGGATVWPSYKTLEGAQAAMSFWFNAKY